MAVLDRKLLRDLMRLWAQVSAIALVMACGVATVVTALGAYRSLEETRSTFYDRYRFANVFASVTRAPMTLGPAIRSMDGVSGIDLRIVRPVIIDVLGMPEPAAGIVVSLPETGEPPVNRLYLRSGRWPDATRPEVAVLDSFARAHGMTIGSRFAVIMNGRKRDLTISAIVVSPEFVYALGPGDMVPDARRFGVLYLPRSSLEGAFDLQGAFNDVVLRTQRHAPTKDIVARLDALLEPYGGTGAIEREHQTSHAFLDNELVQLRAMAAVIPPVFLLVSAFLVNMILTRLIALEREQVGLLKAVGYGSLSVGWHYAELALLIALAGTVIGAAAGDQLGRALTRLYGDFFSFPFLIFRGSVDLYLVGGLVSASAALAGSARGIWQVVRLPPAVAMQPAAPTRYRATLSTGAWPLSHLSQLTLMAMRHMMRFPLRNALTALGTSFAVALLVTALFSFDSIAFMVDNVFFRTERQDATLVFSSARAASALQDVERLPGVMRAEGFRAVPVIMRNRHRSRRLTIMSVSPDGDLVRVLDNSMRHVSPPPGGVMLSARVAELLDLRIGDKATIELLDLGGRSVEAPVGAIVESYVGLAVYMHPDALDRLAGDGPRISGARVALDGREADRLYAAVKQSPGFASLALQAVSRKKFRDTIERNITIMTTVYASLAVIITFGVVYNAARIQLSERARELASLRVFGFTRGEVSRVLMTELAIIVLFAQPLGWLLGLALSWSVVRGFESDLFRVPFVIERSTFGIASLVVLAMAILSALIVRRRIDRLDLVRVLKSRD